MTSDTDTIPPAIARPLRLGAGAIVCFLAALAIWSASARLATTVHASGRLVSSAASYDIQHGFGGQIVWVGVVEQDRVSFGEPLFRMDVRTEEALVAELSAQIADLERTIDVVTRILSSWPDAPGPDIHRADFDAARLKIAALEAAATGYRAQAAAGAREIALYRQRLGLLEEREAKTIRLNARGFSKATDVDEIADLILELAGEREQRTASVVALRNQAQQAESDAQTTAVEFLARLETELQTSQRRASDLRRERYQTEAVIRAAEIRAPADGQIQSLPFDTPFMYAGRGETLATLSQDLDAPRVQLTVPPSAIDQVAVGMQGRLTFNSLPQREMPPVHVVVTAISPEAERDETGAVAGYIATAKIKPKDLERARNVLKDRFKLATDMPISVALAGRDTTLYTYLVSPFLSVFATAFQD